MTDATNTNTNNAHDVPALCYEPLTCPVDGVSVFVCHRDLWHDGPHEGTSSMSDPTARHPSYTAIVHWVTGDSSSDELAELTSRFGISDTDDVSSNDTVTKTAHNYRDLAL